MCHSLNTNWRKFLNDVKFCHKFLPSNLHTSTPDLTVGYSRADWNSYWESFQLQLSKDMFQTFIDVLHVYLVKVIGPLGLVINGRIWRFSSLAISLCRLRIMLHCLHYSNNVLSTLDEVYMKELMVQLVQHALNINPLQSSWIKTYAEIQYGMLVAS